MFTIINCLLFSTLTDFLLLQLTNCTSILKSIDTQNNGQFRAYYILFPEEYSTITKSIKTKLAEVSKQYPRAKLVQSKTRSAEEFANTVKSLLGENVAKSLAEEMCIKNNCVVFLAYGDRSHVVSDVKKQSKGVE